MSGHCCDGGRLSRVNVSVCAVRPSTCPTMIMLPNTFVVRRRPSGLRTPRQSRYRRRLVALERRFLLGYKGAVGALEILALHADRLRLRFGLDGLVEAHRPFMSELRLGDAVGEGRARRDPACERE